VLKVGLSGGIGSGKSQVSRRLAERGAVIIDADILARDVVAAGTPGLAAVVSEFGTDVLAPDGSLDRPRLGSVVFGDPERLAALNAIVHPLVAARTRELMAAAPVDAIVVHDVPLLVENDLGKAYDVVVIVDATEESRLGRLTRDRGMSPEDARARIAAQASREHRLAVADVVIDNNGPLNALDPQLDALWKRLESARS
jgi:dephospho-CoA kinase